jgi:hypothetical protein
MRETFAGSATRCGDVNASILGSPLTLPREFEPQQYTSPSEIAHVVWFATTTADA